MLMMQCADPNTLPAPSRLHQLEQSLSLYPSCHCLFPKPSAFFFISSRLNWRFFLLNVLFSFYSRPKSPPPQPLFFFFLIFLPTLCSFIWRKSLLSERYHVEAVRNQKAKTLSLVVQNWQTHKRWWTPPTDLIWGALWSAIRDTTNMLLSKRSRWPVYCSLLVKKGGSHVSGPGQDQSDQRYLWKRKSSGCTLRTNTPTSRAAGPTHTV